jgi:hypothetical protein
MNLKITNSKGISLKTKDKVCLKDISITVDDTNITKENIKTNANILQCVGNFSEDGTAVAAKIKEGKIAYVNGEKIVGSLRKYQGEYQGIIDEDGTALNYTGIPRQNPTLTCLYNEISYETVGIDARI